MTAAKKTKQKSALQQEQTDKKTKKKSVLRKIYDALLHLAETPQALVALFCVSFIESSFFPIPPDIMIIPMVLGAQKKWFRIALVCTTASVLGAYFGYWIGYAAFETIAKPILNTYDAMGTFEQFKSLYHQYGAWIVACAGFTPFPYKVVTIASGAVGLDLVVFTIASVLSRGARFFLLAFLLYKFGPRIRHFIEKYLGLLTIAFFALLILGFIILKACL